MIEAMDLISLRLSFDGKSIRLRVREQSGQTATVSLPVTWLNTMLNALPRTREAEAVHPLDSWSMDRLGNGQDLVLTLRTLEGYAVSFAMKSWQVQGMATIATYGISGPSPATTIH